MLVKSYFFIFIDKILKKPKLKNFNDGLPRKLLINSKKG
jgi:hypothetical protein